MSALNGSATRRLFCETGGHEWDAPVTRGRGPRSCPDCRTEDNRPAVRAQARDEQQRDTRLIALARRGDQVREDVDQQRLHDRRRPHDLPALERRLRMIADAQLHQDEPHVGPYPLRQALVDLASLCEEWASELPAPTALTIRRGSAAA